MANANIFWHKTGESTVSIRTDILDNMASSASSDEGEIRDTNAEKATTTLPRFDGTPVDRQDRNRPSNSPSMSPEHGYRSKDKDSAERTRSTYSARGSKRDRGDDYLNRSRGDSRSFKVHYEDDTQSYKRRSRVSYEDIDQGPVLNQELQYDERDRYSRKRPRTRSRSPYRSGHRDNRDVHDSRSRRDGNGFNGYPDESRTKSYYDRGDVRSRDIKDQSVSKRGQSPLPADNARHEAKSMQGFSQQSSGRSANSPELEK